jgi:hypothetical protein
MLFSEKNLDGVRVWSTNAKCVLTAIDELYVAYKAAPESAQGKLPVVQMTDVLPVKTNGKDATGKPVSSTNYAPVFKILQWVDRPQALGATVTPITVAQGTPVAQHDSAVHKEPAAATAASGGPLF